MGGAVPVTSELLDISSVMAGNELDVDWTGVVRGYVLLGKVIFTIGSILEYPTAE